MWGKNGMENNDMDALSGDAAPSADADDTALLALAGLLEQLWRVAAAAPGKPCSLAKLSKQSQRPMSLLKRQLTALEQAGLARVAMAEDGRGTVTLTDAGVQLCRQLDGAERDGPHG